MASTNKATGTRGIQVIARAANVLRSLEGEPDGLSLREIADKVGLARSTVQRIVGALVDEQLLIAATPNARVKLGPSLIRLAASANIDVGALLKPYMQDLSRLVEETVDLSVLKGKRAVFINQVAARNRRLQAVSHIGDAFPLHCTANGKALLATMPEPDLDKYLKTNLETFTPNTITDVIQLITVIEDFQKNLITVDREEHTEGICAVGTSFSDPFGQALALSVPIPTHRFSQVESVVSQALIECRNAIILAFGKQPN
jgi:IclR family transcriptional regulator, carbohydrate utilization repressor